MAFAISRRFVKFPAKTFAILRLLFFLNKKIKEDAVMLKYKSGINFY